MSILTKKVRQRRQQLRRAAEREKRAAELNAKIPEGYERMPRPGTLMRASDRYYGVAKDGSFRRLNPGAIVQSGREVFQVQPKGDLKLVGELPPEDVPSVSDEQEQEVPA